MKAVRLSRFGGPEVLELVDIPRPAPEDGEILIRVQSAGVNFFETLLRADRYAATPPLPMILGVEVVGTVEAMGPDVSEPGIGTRVAAPLFASARSSGGYAEYVVTEAASVVPVPDALSAEHATALMVQGLTALHLIRRSPPRNRAVLVTAAAGGVGSLLVQLAKAAGASLVIALASSEEKLALASDLGADLGINYTRGDWRAQVREATGGAGADIAYDLVGGAVTPACTEALAARGELIFGALGRFQLRQADLEDMLSKNQSLTGFALLPLLALASMKSDLAGLFNQVLRGTLSIASGERFPLNQVAEAHRAIESRRTMGKTMLIP